MPEPDQGRGLGASRPGHRPAGVVSPHLTSPRRMPANVFSDTCRSLRNSRRYRPSEIRRLGRGVVGERGLPFGHVAPDDIRQGPDCPLERNGAAARTRLRGALRK